MFHILCTLKKIASEKSPYVLSMFLHDIALGTVKRALGLVLFMWNLSKVDYETENI